MNIAKWRYKLEIFKVKKFLCVMMLFVLAVGVAYSENVGQETKTINNTPAYLTIGTNHGRPILAEQQGCRKETFSGSQYPWWYL